MGAFFTNFSDDHFKAGGLVDNIRAKITDYKFTENGPPGYNAPGTLFFQLELEYVKDGQQVTDDSFYYSMGGKALELLMPSGDGYGLVLNPNNPNGVDVDGVRLIADTKFDLLRKAILAAGFPQSCLVGGPTNTAPFKSIIGLDCHWIQQAVKERQGMAGQERKRPETVFVPNKIYVLSPAAQAVVGGGGGVAAPAGAAGVRGRRPAGAAPAAPAAAAPAARRAAAAPAPAPAAAPAAAPGQAIPYASASPEAQAKVVAYFEKIANDPAQDGGTFAKLLISSVPEPAVRGTIKTLHPCGGPLYTDQDGSQLAALGFGLFDDGAGGVVVAFTS